MVRFPTIARTRWSAVVSALRDLGFNAIDVPLVWREHERARGVFDFDTGPCDVGAMFATVREAGLDLIVRFGPMVTDDAAGLCLPERIFTDGQLHARTRRQNPVLVPDPPRLVPLPSIACQAYRDEASTWVAAASRAVASAAHASGGLLRVIVGDGPHGLLRDDPFEFDHHPEARGSLAAVDPPHDGPHESADEEVRRETSHAVRYREALVAAVLEGGLAGCPVFVAVHGAATISTIAHTLAANHPLALPSPPPTAGTLATWRQVRHACALTATHGGHFDLWSGGPAWYPPMRGSHTVDAARLALAAGARDVTVRMGCAGERWIGAVLSETAQSRPHAPMWRELLAWAAELPDGEERCADLLEPFDRVERARVATAVHPLPLGLLALVGLTPGELAVSEARGIRETSMAEHEEDLRALEIALAGSGVPFRRVAVARSPVAFSGKGAIATFVRKASRSLASVCLRSEPAGGALIRAVQSGHRVNLFAVSRCDQPVQLMLAPGAFHGARGAAITEPVVLEPGEVCLLQGDTSVRHAPTRNPRKHSPRAPAPTPAGSADIDETPAPTSGNSAQVHTKTKLP